MFLPKLCIEAKSESSSVYMGLSEVKGSNLNLKATELRLALPGSLSPNRESDFTPLNSMILDEKPLFPCSISQKLVSGTKRGFSDTVNEFSDTLENMKAQVVGWPPIRSYRKSTLITTSETDNEVDCKAAPDALYVKVSMDGAPYLRKVDLRMYTTYHELSHSLEKMFSGFTLGQCGSHRDLLHGSDYVITYEDKDGDWMLVGDVPWKMFVESCMRLKITKGSDGIGLAPRAAEQSRSPI